MTRLLEGSCRARMVLKDSAFLEQYRQVKGLEELVNQLPKLAADPSRVESVTEFIRTLPADTF